MSKAAVPAGVQRICKSLGLTDSGARDFEWLCLRGCNPSVMGQLLALWKAPARLEFESRPGARHRPVGLRPSRRGVDKHSIELRPLDDLEKAMGGLGLSDLPGLQLRFQRLEQQLRKAHTEAH